MGGWPFLLLLVRIGLRLPLPAKRRRENGNAETNLLNSYLPLSRVGSTGSRRGSCCIAVRVVENWAAIHYSGDQEEAYHSHRSCAFRTING